MFSVTRYFRYKLAWLLGRTAWAPLEEETCQILATMRMQITDLISISGAGPLVFFSDRNELLTWAKSFGLQDRKLQFTKRENEKTIPSPRLENALRICGWVSSPSGRFYIDQIWARAEYTGHKSALRGFAYEFFDILPSAWVRCDIDVDHVINKRRVRFSHPRAWVMLFPVPGSANSPFGKVEDRLPKLSKSATSMTLPPLIAFKLFCGRIPYTPWQLRLAMKDVRGQVEGPYKKAMESAARSQILLTFAPVFYLKRLIGRCRKALGLTSKQSFTHMRKVRR